MGVRITPRRRLRCVLADHLPLHHRLFFAYLFARLLLVWRIVLLKWVVQAITSGRAVTIADGKEYGGYDESA